MRNNPKPTTKHFDTLITQTERLMARADEQRNSDAWVNHFLIKLSLLNGRTQTQRRACEERAK